MLRDRLSAYSGTFAARVVTGRAFIDFCSRGLCTVAECEPVAAMRRCADPRGCAKRLSVSKMPHAGKHHRNLMFIRGGKDFIVANRPSRLNHTARACGRNNIQAIPEREKGIRCDRKARFLSACILRFAASDTRCIEAAHLTRADSIGHAARTKDNGVGFHELRDLPYK